MLFTHMTRITIFIIIIAMIVVVVVTLFPANYTKHDNVTYIIAYLCSNTYVFIIFLLNIIYQ